MTTSDKVNDSIIVIEDFRNDALQMTSDKHLDGSKLGLIILIVKNSYLSFEI